MVFVTLKMPKSLIDSRIRAARPGGSEPPPSLGVRPKLALKEVVEGVFCCSVRVRATKRRRRVFSLGRCHVSDRGERSREARSSRKRWSREPTVVMRACERPNVGDVYSPSGAVTPVTEGKEAMRPEARAERGGRGSLLSFCDSASDQTSETYILPREMSR